MSIEEYAAKHNKEYISILEMNMCTHQNIIDIYRCEAAKVVSDQENNRDDHSGQNEKLQRWQILPGSPEQRRWR